MLRANQTGNGTKKVAQCNTDDGGFSSQCSPSSAKQKALRLVPVSLFLSYTRCRLLTAAFRFDRHCGCSSRFHNQRGEPLDPGLSFWNLLYFKAWLLEGQINHQSAPETLVRDAKGQSRLVDEVGPSLEPVATIVVVVLCGTLVSVGSQHDFDKKPWFAME